MPSSMIHSMKAPPPKNLISIFLNGDKFSFFTSSKYSSFINFEITFLLENQAEFGDDDFYPGLSFNLFLTEISYNGGCP